MDLLNKMREYWEFILIVTGSGGIAGLIKYYYTFKAERKSSIDMLYDELEKLKQRVILQIDREVEHADQMSGKNLILAKLRERCPECYDAVIEQLKTKKENNEQ